MFTKAILPDTLGAIQLVSKLPTIQKAYLAGGTALALQIGHRISVDLDFFISEKFDEREATLELSTVEEFQKKSQAWQTVLGKVGKTEFSLFYYEYPVLKQTLSFEGIHLLDKPDIAAMKIHALEERGTKRDFFDVFFLAKEFTFEEMLGFYDQKYKVLNDHLYAIIRSLSYFADAEADEKSPRMLVDTPWEEVRDFFSKESLRLAKSTLKL